MTEPRAVIDIVGAEAGAHQLLENVGLFVRAFCRAEAGQRAGAVTVTDFLQSPGGAVKRLFPGRRTEMRPWIARVNDLVGYLRHAVLADHWLCETIGIADVV